jgi:hypothetical protein
MHSFKNKAGSFATSIPIGLTEAQKEHIFGKKE